MNPHSIFLRESATDRSGSLYSCVLLSHWNLGTSSSQITADGDAAMNLKDAYSLEGKL